MLNLISIVLWKIPPVVLILYSFSLIKVLSLSNYVYSVCTYVLFLRSMKNIAMYSKDHVKFYPKIQHLGVFSSLLYVIMPGRHKIYSTSYENSTNGTFCVLKLILYGFLRAFGGNFVFKYNLQ